jgi:hypothetical protein
MWPLKDRMNSAFQWTPVVGFGCDARVFTHCHGPTAGAALKDFQEPNAKNIGSSNVFYRLAARGGWEPTMNRLFRVLLLLAWLELGLLLVLLPWSGFWDVNYFLDRYPALILLVLNPYIRGAISGLGILNALMAIEAFRQPAPLADSK